ncbi:MAG: hypothetical protein IJE46_06030 [Clostridia bacterium]|nr:hypothetical protein [Clostridia bacterium]
MLDMLCQIPCACGNEETIKKYIKTKTDGYEDSIGNFIVSKNDGQKKLMIFCGIDEDTLTAMSIDGKKVYVTHQGTQKLPLGSLVSFGGYTGVLQAKDAAKPDKDLYVDMLTGGFENIGAAGIVCAEYTTEENVIFTKDAAEKIAVCAMLECIDLKTDYDASFVFGVQSKNNNKGAIVATREIEPDFVLSFEKTKSEGLTYKAVGKGFVISSAAKEKIERICDKLDIEIKPEADSEQPSCVQALGAPNTVVVGIPVRFFDEIRQACDIKYKDIIKKIIKAFLEEGK